MTENSTGLYPLCVALTTKTETDHTVEMCLFCRLMAHGVCRVVGASGYRAGFAGLIMLQRYVTIVR